MAEQLKKMQAEEITSGDATDEDSAIARTRPAIYVDAFLVEAGEKFFRITFGEGRADTRDLIRFALVMPTEDVRELVKVLDNLLSESDTEGVSKAKSAGQ